MPPKKLTFIITEGSAIVRGKYAPVNVGRKIYPSWQLRFHQAGQLHRPRYKTEPLAREAAKQKAIQLNNGEQSAKTLPPEAAAIYTRALQIISQFPHDAHQPADPASRLLEHLSDHLELKTLLQKVPPKTAAEFYLRHHPTDAHQKTFAQIADHFVTAKKNDGTLARQQQDLRTRLDVLKTVLQLPLINLTAADLTAALDTLQKKNSWTNRTRNHYRATLSNLINHARGAGHIPRDWREIEHVKKHKEKDEAITIHTPEQIAQLLEHTPDDMLPAIILTLFSEIRTSEAIGRPRDKVPPIDWRDINLDTGEVHIITGKVRTAGNRIAHLPKNAIAWLRPHQKKTGSIWKGSPGKFFKHRRAICKAAGIEWRHNAARHSAISYRAAETRNLSQVSDESGTSEATLRRRYRRPLAKAESKKYLNIWPATATKRAIKTVRFGISQRTKSAQKVQPSENNAALKSESTH